MLSLGPRVRKNDLIFVRDKNICVSQTFIISINTGMGIRELSGAFEIIQFFGL